MSDQDRQEPAVDAGHRAGAAPGAEAMTFDEGVSGPTVGERIRRAREAAGLSAADLAQPLNLDLRVIECIERDALDEVPGRPYILAYLRSWAEQLDLDGDALVAQYSAQRAPAEADIQGGTHPTLDVMETRRGGWRRVLGWLIVLLLAAIAVMAVSQLDRERLQTWWQDLRGDSGAAPAAEEEKKRDDGRPAIQGGLEEPPAPPVNQAVREQAAESAAGMRSPAATDLPDMPLAAIQSEEAATSTANDNEAAADLAQGEPSEVAAAPSSEPTLVLRTTSADSWVEIRDANGERLMYDVLAAGEERTFDGAGPFSLVLGNSRGVEIEYQGKPVELGEPSSATGVLRMTVGSS